MHARSSLKGMLRPALAAIVVAASLGSAANARVAAAETWSRRTSGTANDRAAVTAANATTA